MREKIMFIYYGNLVGDTPGVFFVSELNNLCEHFDTIEVFTNGGKSSKEKFKNNEKIKYNFIDKWFILQHCYLIFFMIIDYEFWNEIYNAIRIYRFKFWGYLPRLVVNTFKSYVMLKKVDKVIPNLEWEQDKWIAYSFWHDVEACGVARIKQKYKNILGVTRSHSFEIDEVKDKFFLLNYKQFIHKQLDVISFIAYERMNHYKKNIIDKFYYKENEENIFLYYLGTKKNNQEISPINNTDVYKIVSCSRVIPVKRVELIAEYLCSISKKIEWIHFGSGSSIDYVMKICEKFKHKDILIKLMGNTPNEEIMEYYRNNSIDLFVNLSTSEGLPVSFMEALSYGIPVLATDVGGNNEIIENGFNGFLLPVNVKKEEFQQVMNEFINFDMQKKINMKKNCVNSWEKNFNSNINNKKFFEFLKSK